MKKKTPYLSIVIPTYQSPDPLLRLLSSLSQSLKNVRIPIEIIVVDDGSDDVIVKRLQLGLLQVLEKQKYIISGRVLHLSQNGGPARARNRGVSYAGGEVIVFFDTDVVLHEDTISEIISSFKSDPDLFAMTGVWNKTQQSRSFFPRFKALRDWSYWINERDPRNYYYLFSTRVAAIKRDLFLRLGGFDETYKAALVEDIDLTYRIARRYAVVFNPHVMVDHEFESFAPVAKKYFLRSYYWSKLYRTRKKFDPVATTFKEAVTTMSAGGFVGFLFLGFFSLFSGYYVFGVWLMGLSGGMLLLHLMGVRKFLWFCIREEGVWFAVQSLGMGMCLYLIILMGAIFSWVR